MDDLDEMNAYSKKAEEYFSFIYSAYCNGHFSDLTVESILGFFDCLSVKKRLASWAETCPVQARW